MHDNLKAAIDEYGSLDEQIKALTKRKEDLRKTLMDATLGGMADPASVGQFSLESDLFTFTIKASPGSLRLSKEALEEDGIDTSKYMARGKPYMTISTKRRGQRL